VQLPSLEKPGRGRTTVVCISLLGSLAILVTGLLWSNVLEILWPHALARQAAALLAAAALFILACSVGFGRLAWCRRYGMISAVACGIAICFGLGPTLAACAVALSCLIFGNVVLAIAGCELDDPLIVATVGVAATILLLVGAGIAHLQMIQVFWLFLGSMLTCALLLPRIRNRMLEQAGRLRPSEPDVPWDVIDVACKALVLFEVLFLAVNAAIPERYYDPLAMHFLIPTQILSFGHWTYTPRLSFSFFPIGADYLFSYAMAMGGEMAVKLINFMAVLLASALLHDIVRQIYGRRLAWLAATLFLGIPVTLIETTALFVENTLCLLTIGAFSLLVMQREMRGRSVMVSLAVVLPALAAVKLPGVLVALPAMIIAFSSQDYAFLRRRDWVIITCAAVIGGGLGGLTYAYAWAMTGNPVFPLMNNIFHSPFWPPVAFQDSSYVGHLSPWLLYRMTFDSGTYLQSWPGSMGFVFMALLPAGVVAAILSPMRAIIAALLIAAFYIAVTLGEEQYIRYIFPVFPLVLLICIHGMATLGRSRWSRIALVATALALGVLDIYKLPSAGWILLDSDMRWAFDRTRQHDMLAAEVPERLANDLINAIAPGQPHVIYACDAYGAFLRGTPVYTNWYNMQVQAELVAAKTPAQMKSIMDAEQVTFAVVNNTSTLPTDRAIGLYMEQYATFIAQIGRLRIYRLDGAGQPR
jgi:hypothetical protein